MKDRALYSIKEARELLGGISRNSIYRILGSGSLKRRAVTASIIVASLMIDILSTNGICRFLDTRPIMTP